ncbi:MAG: hypothetical protein ABI056_02160 [Caulobacteraceae bacterium]
MQTDEYPGAGARLLAEDVHDEERAVDVDSRGRLVGEDQRRARHEEAGE